MRFILSFIIVLNSFINLCSGQSILAETSHYKVYSSEIRTKDDVRPDKKYPISNLSDKNVKTAWVFEPGIDDTMSIVISYDFNSYLPINGIAIINGYAKSERLYYANEGVASFTVSMNDTIFSFNCADTLDFQEFHFPEKPVKTLEITITKVRQGTRYKDLCISELTPITKDKYLIDEIAPYVIQKPYEWYDSDIYHFFDGTKIDLDVEVNGHLGVVNGIFNQGKSKVLYPCQEMTFGNVLLDLKSQKLLDISKIEGKYCFEQWLDDNTIILSKESDSSDTTQYLYNIDKKEIIKYVKRD